MNTTPSPIGIALGFLYLGMVVMFVRWMFNVSRSVEQARRTQRTRSNPNCIIVLVTELTTSSGLVHVACRLASERQVEILLVHVIEIPFTLGLGVPLPEAEEEARHLLRTAEGIVKQHNLKVESRLLRNRTTTEALLELARETGAEAIVVGPGTPPWWSFTRIEHTAAALLRHAPCQVVITKTSALV